MFCRIVDIIYIMVINTKILDTLCYLFLYVLYFWLIFSCGVFLFFVHILPLVFLIFMFDDFMFITEKSMYFGYSGLVFFHC